MQIGVNNFLTQKEEGFLDKEGRLFSVRGGQELHDVFMGRQASLSACPYCGSNEGAYERIKADFMQHYKIDGTLIEENEMRVVKTAHGGCRCLACHQEMPEAFQKKTPL